MSRNRRVQLCNDLGCGDGKGVKSPAYASNPATAITPGPVLFFDGECGLCQRVVRFLLWLDHGGQLRYASLQGPTAHAYLHAHGLPAEDIDTIVFVPDWSQRDRRPFLVRTEGVIASLRACGRVGRILGGLVAIWPVRWRDAVYRGIGHIRYRIFGPWKPRPLPRPEWGRRFLD